MGECPGCDHGDGITKDCGVYQEYGKGQHWFIQPSVNEGMALCDFCGLEGPDENMWDHDELDKRS